ncbi:hypothetical protein, partial [Candidatus Symbiopectobacterium sp. NZEC135]|uniref:hypothetical protein n=1 Tax=Candidatus Symbiopectobacterium sp. NZEC135 TaxID=2820471 RepID=UPI0022261FB0
GVRWVRAVPVLLLVLLRLSLWARRQRLVLLLPLLFPAMTITALLELQVQLFPVLFSKVI